jgi:hypothetical protein
MRKDTPEKARKLLQTLNNVRTKTSHPIMGGFDYYELFTSIMENNDSQVSNYLYNALRFYENYNNAMDKLDKEPEPWTKADDYELQ